MQACSDRRTIALDRFFKRRKLFNGRVRRVEKNRFAAGDLAPAPRMTAQEFLADLKAHRPSFTNSLCEAGNHVQRGRDGVGRVLHRDGGRVSIAQVRMTLGHREVRAFADFLTNVSSVM